MNKLYAGFENFIKEEKLTEEEVIIIKWQYGYFGNFFLSLIKCFRLADVANKARLDKAFPDISQALKKYDQEEGFFENCEKKAEKFKLNYQR